MPIIAAEKIAAVALMGGHAPFLNLLLLLEMALWKVNWAKGRLHLLGSGVHATLPLKRKKGEKCKMRG